MDKMPRIFSFACIFISVLCLVDCGKGPDDLPSAPDPETYVKAEASPTVPSQIPPLRFTDITTTAGIHFVHQNGYSGKKYLPETLGSGGGFLDYNQDGNVDIFLVNARYFDPDHGNEPPSYCALYEGDGAGYFVDVTQKAGLRICLYGMGCSIADYDGDGDDDLFITAVLDGNRLFQNQGDGTFKEVTRSAGVTSPKWTDAKGKSHPYWSTSSAFFDYDRDGWVDLLVVNYVRWSIENDIFTTRVGLGKSFTTPDLYTGLSPLLYRNRGDGTFEDVTKKAGVYNPEGKSLGVSLEDFNQDGWLDFAIANDSQPNFLYINQQNGTFQELGLAAGIGYDENGRARAGMGIDIARLHPDRPSIAIGNFSHEPLSLYTLQSDLFFVDTAGRSRISRPTLLSLTFGLIFFDYDLDGYLDMAAANGHIEPDINRVEKEVTYLQRPQLFRNNGKDRFVEATQDTGTSFGQPMVARGLVYGDIDNDGDLDLLFTGCGQPPRLLRNDDARSHQHFIRFKLIGLPPNTNAIGATVTLETDETRQTRMVRTGSSYLSQSEFALTFGLGSNPSLESIHITWPSGKKQTLSPLPSIDTLHRVKEPR